AAAVGGQGLLAAIVYVEAVGIERGNGFDADIVDICTSKLINRFDGRYELLTIQRSLVSADQTFELAVLVLVSESDQRMKSQKVITHDGQFVDRLGLVDLHPSSTIGH